MEENNKQEPQYTHKLSQFFAPNFTFTKRQLGIALLVLGILGFTGLLALDLLGGGREGGIGPAQRSALLLMAFIVLIGATLIPLGDKPV